MNVSATLAISMQTVKIIKDPMYVPARLVGLEMALYVKTLMNVPAIPVILTQTVKTIKGPMYVLVMKVGQVMALYVKT